MFSNKVRLTHRPDIGRNRFAKPNLNRFRISRFLRNRFDEFETGFRIESETGLYKSIMNE